MQPCWVRHVQKLHKMIPLKSLNSSAYKNDTLRLISFIVCGYLIMWCCISEARQQKSSDQISQLTPTSTGLTQSPFKTNPKTLKKGEEKKTEPTAADPSTAVLLKNNDKVKGQSALLIYGLTTNSKHFQKPSFWYYTGNDLWKQLQTNVSQNLSHNSECCYLSSCCLDCEFRWCSL